MPNPDETPTSSESTEQPQEQRTFTQAELDSIVKERLKREREKHADYDERKAKAEKFDAAEEANKSELQKAVERAEALEKELSGLKAQQQRTQLVTSVARETGIDAELLAAMNGTTEDEIRANADLLKAKFAAVPGDKSDPHDQGGQHPEPKRREIPTIF